MAEQFKEKSTEELKAELEQLGFRTSNADKLIDQFHGLKISQEEEAAKLEAEFLKAKAKLQEFQEAKILAIRKKSDFELLAEQIQQELKEREAIEEAKRKNALLDAKWENLLAGAPWRERAHDYQIFGAKQFAQTKRMILADDMGLGKTLASIISLDLIRAATHDSSPDNPYEAEAKFKWDPAREEEIITYVNGVEKPCGIKVLYIAPNGTQDNVVEEFKRYSPHRTVIPLANMPAASRKFAIDIAKKQDDYVVVVNYDAWRSSEVLINQLLNLNFDTIIIDEAHYIKDQRTEYYWGVARLVFESHAPFVLPMTGTPVLNNPVDLFPILQFIAPDKAPSRSQYLNRYCTQQYDGDGTRRWVWRTGGVGAIAKVLGKKYLRRTKIDVGINLPKMTIEEHNIKIDEDAYPEQARARRTMRASAAILLKDLDEEGKQKSINAASRLAMYTRLRQIETWPAGISIKDPATNEVLERVDIEESQKLDYILDRSGNGLLAAAVSSERAMVFSQFVPPLKELAIRCKENGIRAAIFTGDTPPEIKNQIRHDFDRKFQGNRPYLSADRQELGFEWDVALCHYRVGGEGLNFTEASQMIIIDEQWNPGKRDQAYNRINRIGQEKPMTVHVVRDKPSIDDWLAKIMSYKEQMTDEFEKGMPSAAEFLEAMEKGLI